MIDGRRSYIAGRWVEGERSFEVENPADESCFAEAGVTPLPESGGPFRRHGQSFDQGVWADLPVPNGPESSMPFSITSRNPGRSSSTRSWVRQVSRGRWPKARRSPWVCPRSPDDRPLPVDVARRSEPGPGRRPRPGPVALSFRRHEPVGVVSAITPYNGAIIMAFQKLIPALMAGNSVILRPSPLTPFSSLVFGAAADAAGLPAGVLSVVIEDGAAGAELLTTDPAVDMVSFTGSTAVGRQILAQAAPTVKRVALELGGKSAQIYLDDAMDRVARAHGGRRHDGRPGVRRRHADAGAERRKDEVLEAVCATYGMITVGDPSDPATMMGPLISAGQRERCERYVALAEEHGAKVACGGGRPAGLDKGYYFEPTVLDLPDNSNPAAQEEIFGPVIGVIGYEDLDDAVRIANDSIYGLSGQVYGADVATATAVARRIRAGAVNVNTGVFSAYARAGATSRAASAASGGPRAFAPSKRSSTMAIGELR